MGVLEPPRRGPHPAWVPAGVFLAALLMRLIYLRQLHDSGLWDYLRLDPLYYHDWAVRISRGEVVGKETYEMTPLYAYALGGLFKLFGYSLLLPRLLQALLGAGTCALVALLGLRIFGAAEGILGGLALAFYGPALFHDAQIMKTALTAALTTAAACALYLSAGRRAAALAAGGALLGLTALSQENINITLPFLLGWIAWRSRPLPWALRAARGAALMAGFACAVAPATIRNYAVSGDLVLITAGGGEVFYTGNNELASGKYRPPPFVRPDPFFEHEDFRAEAARRLGRPVTRKESDSFWWREGWRFVAADPLRWAALLWDKLATYFTDFERPDNYSYYNFQRFVPLLRLPLPRFGWIAPLGLVGLALSARRWPDLLPLHVALGAYVASALLFFTQDRYRMPMVPLLALFAAHAAASLVRAARLREARRLTWAALAVAALALAINRDPRNERLFEAQNHGILGEMFLHAGRPREATEEFLATLAMMEERTGGPGSAQEDRVIASAHYGIVLAADATGARGAGADDDGLVAHLRAAGAAPDPDLRRDASDRLAALLARRGDAAGAAEAWAAAVQADPSGPGSFARRLRMAEALHKAGRPLEALRAVEEALREAPSEDPILLADAHFGEALIYLRDLPDAEQAARHLREVLRLNPCHPRAAWIRETLESLAPSRGRP